MINLMIDKRFGGATGLGLDFIPVIPTLLLSLSSSSATFTFFLLLTFTFFLLVHFFIHHNFHLLSLLLLLLSLSSPLYFHRKKSLSKQSPSTATSCRHFCKLFHWLLICSEKSDQACNSPNFFRSKKYTGIANVYIMTDFGRDQLSQECRATAQT